MQALERESGVLSVSAAHGFPWGDTPHIGTKVLVTTDGQPDLGAELAATLGAELREVRGRGTPPHLSLEEGLARAAAASDGPVVLADTGDNSGGGAANDSTFVAHAMMRCRHARRTAIGPLWDPISVDMCRAAGSGGRPRASHRGQGRPAVGRRRSTSKWRWWGSWRMPAQTFAGEPSPLGNVAGVRERARAWPSC